MAQGARGDPVRRMLEHGFKVADVEVRVSEFLKWRKNTKRYDVAAVSHYIAPTLDQRSEYFEVVYQ